MWARFLAEKLTVNLGKKLTVVAQWVNPFGRPPAAVLARTCSLQPREREIKSLFLFTVPTYTMPQRGGEVRKIVLPSHAHDVGLLDEVEVQQKEHAVGMKAVRNMTVVLSSVWCRRVTLPAPCSWSQMGSMALQKPLRVKPVMLAKM
jgi:hypothetical protein